MKISPPIFTVAKKEFTDAIRNSLFGTLAFALLFLVAVSVLVASFAFKAQVAQYNSALAQLSPAELQSIALTPPAYYPLQMLRGTVEYLEIIGAVMALALGYLAIAKEKGNNTSRLLLIRPLSGRALVGGKLLGATGIFAALIFGIGLFAVLAVTGIGHVPFTAAELIKLALGLAYTFLYLLFFFCFAAALALALPSLPRALMLAFALWLVFVLIIPQVGDTMDPDNQVPGGFFASMHMTQDGQAAVINQFKKYENFRNALEVSSVEKHYERLVFATLGIKAIYNDKPLGFIMRDKWGDLLVLLAFFGAGLALVFRRPSRILAASP
ncbi:MAG: ABC transporter permease subunit [Patescibacteria group bacterium]|nr:ABC transporter permease subunit [Patescibacteria group bacterium]